MNRSARAVEPADGTGPDAQTTQKTNVDLLASLLADIDDPEVWVATDRWLGVAVSAIDTAGRSTTVVADTQAVAGLGWSGRSVVSECSLDVHSGSVGVTAVRGSDETAVIDTDSEPASALVGALGERPDCPRSAVEWDTIPRARLVETVGRVVSSTTADRLSERITETVVDNTDPVVMLLLSAAESRARLSSVREAAGESGLCDPSTVSRRLKRLRSEGRVSTVPITRDGPGTPDKRIFDELGDRE